MGSKMWASLTSENRRQFIRYVSKIVPEWNGHLEISSRPQAKENSRQYLLLRTDNSQKKVDGRLWNLFIAHHEKIWLEQYEGSKKHPYRKIRWQYFFVYLTKNWVLWKILIISNVKTIISNHNKREFMANPRALMKRETAESIAANPTLAHERFRWAT